MRSSTTSSTAAAIGAEALPAPTTMTRRKSESTYSVPEAEKPVEVRVSARRTASPGSTAARAAASAESSAAAALSGSWLARSDIDRFTAGQQRRDVAVGAQEPLEIALD